MKILGRSLGVFALVLPAALLGFLPNTSLAVQQNFEAIFAEDPQAEALRYRLTQTGGGTAPAVQTVGGWDGNFLRLAYQENSQGANVAFNQVHSGAYEALEFTFDFNIFRPDNPPASADGIGFAFLNSANFGSDTTSPTPTFTEEPNLAGSLGVGFDTWNNPDLDPLPDGATVPNSISLHYDGARVGLLDLTNEAIFDIENGLTHTATISVVPDSGAGGSNVSVSLTDGVATVNAFDNVFIPGLAPYDGRIAFAARTGGENANHDLDNIRQVVTPVGGTATEVLNENFTDIVLPPPPPADPIAVGGTPFALEQRGTNPGPNLMRTYGGSAGGQQEGFLRVANEIGGNFNMVSFDQTDTNEERVTVEFRYRGLSQEGSRADGFSLLVVPADTYGTTGPIEDPFAADGVSDFGGPAEEPNIGFGLGIGFDTFEDGGEGPNPQGNVGNHISLHWDAAELDTERVLLDPDTEIDLVNNEWNDVKVTVTSDGFDGTVSMEITDGTDGSVHTIFQDVPVVGLFWGGLGLGNRIAFAARTGGAFDNYDLDNVHVWYGDQRPTDPPFPWVDPPPEPTNAGPADFDEDGDVDEDDYAIWQANFPTPTGATTSTGDATGDGANEGGDFLAWMAAFGSTAPPSGATAIPEPATLGLLALLGLFALAAGRRQH